MSQNPASDTEYFKDHLVIRHADNPPDRFTLPSDENAVTRIGRELDNDVVLTDPRASRYHATIRRTADGLEVKDLGSANGTMIGATRLEANTWHKLVPGQVVQLGETKIFWEKSVSAQSTVMMTVPKKREPTAVSPAPPPAPTPRPSTPVLPWAIGLGATVFILILVGLVLVLTTGGLGGQPTATAIVAQPTVITQPTSLPSLSQQTPGSAATPTPTVSGPQMAIPVVELVSHELRPFIFQGLMSRDKIALVVEVRVQNIGNAPFKISTGDFLVRTPDTGQVFKESGGTLSEEGLNRLGAINRFNNLTLPAGGSVAESVIFDLDPNSYELELVFQSPETSAVVLGLGTVHAGRELAKILGTPVAEETLVAAVTPTSAPTPTATRPAAIPAPQVVPRSALAGTIAYAVFNGASYDLYLGQVNGSGSKLWRTQASQPAFSPDGSRMAFHSWSNELRGLVTIDMSGANQVLITNFIEDQLPTWTADGKNIILLTRRSGGRQSQLVRVDANKEIDQGQTIGEGEYPTVGADGQLVFKGWGQTAYGLRIASADMQGIQTITNVDEDTAPALSPDGKRVLFMSRREGNWEVYIINVDGSGMKRLTNDPANDGLPTWSPDGNAIAFVSNRGGPWAIWAMTPEGAGLRQLFTMEGSSDGFVGTDTYASRGWAEERISWTK